MSKPATPVHVYHITHVDNLASILSDDWLYADARRIVAAKASHNIGMTNINERRLRLPVRCHAGDCVGEYVPFYFAPRSVMLYIAFRGNHPEYTYKGGQEPFGHLEADLNEVVAWANAAEVRWAFTTRNAGATHTDFFCDLASPDKFDWTAVAAHDFQGPGVEDEKQAEFLVPIFSRGAWSSASASSTRRFGRGFRLYWRRRRTGRWSAPNAAGLLRSSRS